MIKERFGVYMKKFSMVLVLVLFMTFLAIGVTSNCSEAKTWTKSSLKKELKKTNKSIKKYKKLYKKEKKKRNIISRQKEILRWD